MSKLQAIISQRLKEVRKQHYETIREAANALGMKPERIANWENENIDRKPNLDDILKLAEFYKVDAAYLIGISNNPTGERGDYVTADKTPVEVNGQNIAMPNASADIGFKPALLQKLGLNSKGISLLELTATDSAPTGYNPGDLLLIDRSPTAKNSAGLFAISNADAIWLRNIQPAIAGGFTISCPGNDNYGDETISPEALEKINIIGKVVWVGAAR